MVLVALAIEVACTPKTGGCAGFTALYEKKQLIEVRWSVDLGEIEQPGMGYLATPIYSHFF